MSKDSNVQTKKEKSKDTNVQTKKEKSKDTNVQTKNEKSKDTNVQTKKEKSKDTNNQTKKEKSKDKNNQTKKEKSKDTNVQTKNEKSKDTNVQTKKEKSKDTNVQTKNEKSKDTNVQTKNEKIKDTNVQTKNEKIKDTFRQSDNRYFSLEFSRIYIENKGTLHWNCSTLFGTVPDFLEPKKADTVPHFLGYLSVNMSTDKQRNISLFYYPYCRTLRRGDPIKHIIIGTQLRDLFLIDVEEIGAKVVFEKLTPLLEDRYLDKVVYDCRYIADTLLSTYNCRANSFLDVQLLEVMTREEGVSEEVPVKVLDMGLFLLRFHRTHGNHGNHGNLQSRRHDIDFCNFHRRNDLDSSQTCFVEQCRLITSLWRGEKEMKMEELGGLFVLMNDCVFSYIERCNPSVTDWTRWWVNSSRYSDVIRTKDRRKYDKYDTNDYLPLNILTIAKCAKIGVKSCPYCIRTLTNGCFEKSRTKIKCRICHLIDTRERTNGQSSK
ncbi:hypothetical protein ACHWQZ_G007266 [Mnemiopsis leidyi]